MDLKMRVSALLITIGLLIPTMAGCASDGSSDKGSQIVCTVFPVYEITREIAGDRADVTLLAKPGVEPHDWEPGSDDMLALEKTKMLIKCGAGMEPWLDSCLEALDNKDIKVCDASNGVSLMDFEESEEHLEEEGHHHDGVDPHYWLSLDNAVAMAKNINTFLCENDGANKDYYYEKTDKFIADVYSLKESYVQELDAYKGSTLIVSHEAYGYLCRDLGVDQLAIDGLSPESEPDAKTVASVIDYINDNGVKVIYYDDMIDPSVARAISDETGAVLLVLRTLETVDEGENSEDTTYCNLMKHNLDSLKEGFAK